MYNWIRGPPSTAFSPVLARWLCVSIRPCQTGNVGAYHAKLDDIAGDSGLIGPGGGGVGGWDWTTLKDLKLKI